MPPIEPSIAVDMLPANRTAAAGGHRAILDAMLALAGEPGVLAIVLQTPGST